MWRGVGGATPTGAAPLDFTFLPKDAQCSETDFLVQEFFLRLLVFEIWSMLYSTFVVNWSGTQTNSEKQIMLRGLRPSLNPQTPDTFGLIGKLILHSFQNNTQLFWEKKNIGSFLWGGRSACHLFGITSRYTCI